MLLVLDHLQSLFCLPGDDDSGLHLVLEMVKGAVKLKPLVTALAQKWIAGLVKPRQS